MPPESRFVRHRRLQQRMQRRRRIFRVPLTRLIDRENPLERYNAVQFKNRYHMTKDTCLFLLRLIGAQLISPIRRGIQLPPTIQFLAALRFYCSGSFQLVIGDCATLNQSTISRLIKRVSVLLAQLRPRYIKFPTYQEAGGIRDGFYRIAGFPGVSGAVDGCQIDIVSPGGPDAELYRNRKGEFSLNVQGICDHELNFTNVVAKWYGSCHDTRMFENSRIGAEIESGTTPGLLLGDSGYPLTSYLMTPFLNPGSGAERSYNYSQIRTRGTIERTFGIWKRRYPCLNHLRTKLSTSLAIIVATAVLHNITRKRNDLFAEDYATQNDDDTEISPRLPTITGKAKRLAIVSSHFTI